MEKILNRFYSKIEKHENGCWNWTSGCSGSGYGQFYYNKKTHIASRASWELHFQKIPQGMCVCHKCDNPKCVNPHHLFIGTSKDNTQDMIKKGRQGGVVNLFVRRGELHPNAKLNEDQVKTIRVLYETGCSQVKIGELFNVSRTHVSRIVRKLKWHHI